MKQTSANTPPETPLERLLSRLERVRCHGGYYMACCPAHDDRSPSLSIRTSETGDVLLHCFAGCSPESVVAACGLSLRDLFARLERHERSSQPDRYRWQDRLPVARPSAVRRGESGRHGARHRALSTKGVRSQTGSYAPQPRSLQREIAATTAWTHIATYPYTDETGTILFSVDRLERSVRYLDAPERWHRQKRFLQWHIDAAGQRVNNVQGCRMVLYMLPEVRRAVADGSPVIIVEGEKDADTANLFFREEIGNGYVATTNAGGAGKWCPEYSVSLAGAHVILCGDADLAGIEHMVQVGRSIASLVRSIRFVDINTLLRDCNRNGTSPRENNDGGSSLGWFSPERNHHTGGNDGE